MRYFLMHGVYPYKQMFPYTKPKAWMGGEWVPCTIEKVLIEPLVKRGVLRPVSPLELALLRPEVRL